jgi:transcriptional regulator with GAF, ATPase, and Fis domain
MAVSTAGLRQALEQLADLRSAPGSIEEGLERVVAAADALFGVDGTALLLIDRDQVLRILAASDRRASLLEELEAEHGEGPCADAFADKQPVAADDLAGDDRWPAFAPAAAARGLRAALASPVPYGEQAVGVVALLVLNAMEARERGRLAGELQVALDSRVVIEQAKGVLVGRHGLTTRQAFERLRRQARDQRRPLTEVARSVVEAAERR